MEKRSFTTPFWVMLVTTCLFLAWELLFLSFYSRAKQLTFLWLVQTFIWPLVFFIETIAYWMIRNRIMHPALARVHVGSVIFGFFLLPLILILMNGFLVKERFSAADLQRMAAAAYWFRLFRIASVVVGHICFVIVLIASSLRRDPPSNQADNNVNLLDDVI